MTASPRRPHARKLNEIVSSCHLSVCRLTAHRGAGHQAARQAPDCPALAHCRQSGASAVSAHVLSPVGCNVIYDAVALGQHHCYTNTVQSSSTRASLLTVGRHTQSHRLTESTTPVHTPTAPRAGAGFRAPLGSATQGQWDPPPRAAATAPSSPPPPPHTGPTPAPHAAAGVRTVRCAPRPCLLDAPSGPIAPAVDVLSLWTSAGRARPVPSRQLLMHFPCGPVLVEPGRAAAACRGWAGLAKPRL